MGFVLGITCMMNPRWRDQSTWSAAMRDEWSDDLGKTAA
jgi:hypothetical protein